MLLLAACFVGMASGLPVEQTITVIKKDFGGIRGNIGIVIIAGTIIMAGPLHADLGLVIMTGFLVSIPVMLAGYLYAIKVASRFQIDANPEMDLDQLPTKYGKLPGALHSFPPFCCPATPRTSRPCTTWGHRPHPARRPAQDGGIFSGGLPTQSHALLPALPG